MVNARMSARSFAAGGRAPRFIGALLAGSICASRKATATASRLAALGARAVAGDRQSKYDAPAPPADLKELAALSGLTSGRQIWIAASTHEGEETDRRAAHRRLR